jgi:hypothetical protein
MRPGVNFADPEFEPTDAELEELSHEAFSDVAARRARALEQLQERIAALRADVLSRVKALAGAGAQ